MTDTQTRIGFIGGGNMATAIIGGLMKAGHRPDCIQVSDPSETQLKRISRAFPGGATGTDNLVTLASSDIVVLAVKPQLIAEIMQPLAGVERPDDQLVISVMAGVSLATLGDLMAPTRNLVRIMPNQPALVGSGMSVLTATEQTSPARRKQAEYIAGVTGKAEWVDDERLMDAVTAVSGSGPAYFYLLMEAMEAAARDMGLPEELARTLTRQTAFGASKVAIESDLELAALRASVTSKGGTTAAALAAFEDAGFRDIVGRALRAARDRSVELGAALRPNDNNKPG